MKPYHLLSHGGQFRRVRRLAEAALDHYDLGPVELRPLVHIENTTFRVDGSDARYALRVHRPGYRSLPEIRSELMWLDALSRETDIVVPQPIATRDGEMVTTVSVPLVPEARHVVLLHWVEGRFYRRGPTPARMERVGEVTARLHTHASRFTPPAGFERSPVMIGPDGHSELADFCAKGLDSHSASAAHSVEFSSKDRETFERAIEVVVQSIDTLDRDSERYGLIHADLHLANCLFEGDEVRVIDFDDCGLGHFASDAGISLWYLRDRPDFEELRAAYLKGYRKAHPLCVVSEASVETFIAARALQISMWVLSRCADSPSIRAFAPRLLAREAGRLRTWMATGQAAIETKSAESSGGAVQRV